MGIFDSEKRQEREVKNCLSNRALDEPIQRINHAFLPHPFHNNFVWAHLQPTPSL